MIRLFAKFEMVRWYSLLLIWVGSQGLVFAEDLTKPGLMRLSSRTITVESETLVSPEKVHELLTTAGGEMPGTLLVVAPSPSYPLVYSRQVDSWHDWYVDQLSGVVEARIKNEVFLRFRERYNEECQALPDEGKLERFALLVGGSYRKYESLLARAHSEQWTLEEFKVRAKQEHGEFYSSDAAMRSAYDRAGKWGALYHLKTMCLPVWREELAPWAKHVYIDAWFRRFVEKVVGHRKEELMEAYGLVDPTCHYLKITFDFQPEPHDRDGLKRVLDSIVVVEPGQLDEIQLARCRHLLQEVQKPVDIVLGHAPRTRVLKLVEKMIDYTPAMLLPVGESGRQYLYVYSEAANLPSGSLAGKQGTHFFDFCFKRLVRPILKEVVADVELVYPGLSIRSLDEIERSMGIIAYDLTTFGLVDEFGKEYGE